MINSKKWLSVVNLISTKVRNPSTFNIWKLCTWILVRHTTLKNTFHISSLWSHLLVFVVNKIVNNYVAASQELISASKLCLFCGPCTLSFQQTGRRTKESWWDGEWQYNYFQFEKKKQKESSSISLRPDPIICKSSVFRIVSCNYMQLHSHGYASVVKAGFLQTSTTCILVTVLQYDMFLVSL